MKLAEEAKQSKYRRACRRAGADFSPFIVSAYGTIAPGADAILKICAERISGGRQSRHYGQTLHLLRSRIQASVMRGVAQCLLGRSEFKPSGALREKREEPRHETHPHLASLL